VTVSATRRLDHVDGARISVTDMPARNDIVLIDKNHLSQRDEDDDADDTEAAVSPGTKATVVNTTVFYAASACAVAAVVFVFVAIFIFCRCCCSSAPDKKRRHGNLIRRDNSVFRSFARRRCSFDAISY